MAIFKPIKKWLLPILFAILGLVLSLTLFPSKQDAIFNEWTRTLTKLNEKAYNIETVYTVDDTTYSQSKGYWDESLAYYEVTTPFSDGTSFQFDVYFSKENFYINSGNEWSYGEMPHRISTEFVPLDHPFNWIATFLQEADSVSKEVTSNGITYHAIFQEFSDIEFRGIRLQQQTDTSLVMSINNRDNTITIVFNAQPVRPDDIGIFTSYPKSFSYEISLTESSDRKISLPKEADNAVLIE